MALLEQNRWVDENWGDLRVKFLTDCAHGEHTFTVQRFVLRETGGVSAWEHDATVESYNRDPAPREGVRFSAALEDAWFDGVYGDPAASVAEAIAAAPGWPCEETE